MTSDLIESRISEIRERLAKATKGPWIQTCFVTVSAHLEDLLKRVALPSILDRLTGAPK